MICYLCNDDTDTRPYGEKGQQVCFDCGTSAEHVATTTTMFERTAEAASREGYKGIVVITDDCDGVRPATQEEVENASQ